MKNYFYLFLFVCSCVGHKSPPTSYWWWMEDRPVTVFIDSKMSEQCIASSLKAVSFWSVYVDYLRVDFAREKVSANQSEILIRQGRLDKKYNESKYYGISRYSASGARMHSDVTTLAIANPGSCSVNVIAHELGHALGIHEHNPTEGMLMYYVPGALQLSDYEIAWVR